MVLLDLQVPLVPLVLTEFLVRPVPQALKVNKVFRDLQQ